MKWQFTDFVNHCPFGKYIFQSVLKISLPSAAKKDTEPVRMGKEGAQTL